MVGVERIVTGLKRVALPYWVGKILILRIVFPTLELTFPLDPAFKDIKLPDQSKIGRADLYIKTLLLGSKVHQNLQLFLCSKSV
ncbi:hypothetical protein Mic7113_4594 [Allocoleopsis franciscana PCC 7113]|uniref:Uncharacterized protein n=1 Tax=Allocoleopsis franciscana PCC 7113 TaxID=1173027 RepID=K9WIN5_9CYAN|nr:hypothetical protein Mic7113_4594 [Allocoleopsis franciscana PCC 7113]